MRSCLFLSICVLLFAAATVPSAHGLEDFVSLMEAAQQTAEAKDIVFYAQPNPDGSRNQNPLRFVVENIMLAFMQAGLEGICTWLPIMLIQIAVVVCTIIGTGITGALLAGEIFSPSMWDKIEFTFFYAILTLFQIIGLIGICIGSSTMVAFILYAQVAYFVTTLLMLIVQSLACIKQGGAMGLVFAAILAPIAFIVVSLTVAYLKFLMGGGVIPVSA
eukprot:GDKI01043369.1.p1 GENE.GDKI01043369.1~~GDKI01043369.1.p1  ORF type:complete len:218 (-),score=34.85 GDKI01043369.1:114-767(-)